MLIIDDLLFAPFNLGKIILERIRDEVDEQTLKTEDSVRKKYMEIQMLYESGELNEKDYQEWIAVLDNRLKEIKEYKGGEADESKRSD